MDWRVEKLSAANNRSLEQVKEELKRLIVENLALENLTPEGIGDDTDLFGDTGLVWTRWMASKWLSCCIGISGWM